MTPKPFLLRLLLSVLLCLNASTSLWASAHMTLDTGASAHDGAAHRHAGQGGHAHETAAQDILPATGDPSPDAHDHGDRHCTCGAGMAAGCACECSYPAGTISVCIPFAAHDALRAAAPAHVEIHSPQTGIQTIFRPPIG
ncbi:CopL family metal-binding regulatory protein [Luteimonas sp. BDR2-5]|uniref:CopL family metal-binding regulatory protein n=1 Tax=Proluteimonas luteida TaxID=2878685 RepID=UPI001E37200C|nr:CopL family metal-binding regulatory protein [Luteimonas sp. BDR2-5]MCD9028256.1 CopL family metal-binding regulatory protein [Luteimonas sp. BDR2-5]